MRSDEKRETEYLVSYVLSVSTVRWATRRRQERNNNIRATRDSEKCAPSCAERESQESNTETGRRIAKNIVSPKRTRLRLRRQAKANGGALHFDEWQVCRDVTEKFFAVHDVATHDPHISAPSWFMSGSDSKKTCKSKKEIARLVTVTPVQTASANCKARRGETANFLFETATTTGRLVERRHAAKEKTFAITKATD